MDNEIRICTDCSILEKEKLDILFKVLDNENDVTVTDRNGVLLRVSDSYEARYHVRRSEIIGKSAALLERLGIFRPSVTLIVLKEQRKVTILQSNKSGEKILTTGVPIFDQEGEIQYVVSYQAIDIAEMQSIGEQYDKLTQFIRDYNDEVHLLKMKELHNRFLITKSKCMNDIKDLIDQIADTNVNVLITGETGVGKSTIAKLIHQTSTKRNGPFVEINCATIPEALIESELFGYEGGAFTGANSTGKKGKVELARGGTLFLDEIGELPLNMQIKFLHVIQERVITRVGGIKKIDVDFHLIAATNSNIEKGISEGKFREDLYYRLNVIPIHIPPLRHRKEDIIPLIDFFIKAFNKKYNRSVEFEPDFFLRLQSLPWHGNIRQLENAIERIVITAKDNCINEEVIRDIVNGIGKGRSAENVESAENNREPFGTISGYVYDKMIAQKTSLEKMIDEYEEEIFTLACKKYKTSVKVAQALKISQSTAVRKMHKYLAKQEAQQ